MEGGDFLFMEFIRGNVKLPKNAKVKPTNQPTQNSASLAARLRLPAASCGMTDTNPLLHLDDIVGSCDPHPCHLPVYIYHLGICYLITL